MNFRSMRLSQRLGVAFGMIVVLSLISSAIAAFKLHDLEGNLDQIVSVNDVRVELNSKMATSVHIISRVIRTVALLDSDAARRTQEPKIGAANDAYDNARLELKKLPSAKSNAALNLKVDQAASKARPLNEQFLKASLGGDRTSNELLIKEVIPATQEWLDAISNNVEFQRKENARAYVTAKADYDNALYTLVLSVAASVAVAAALATVVVRSILGELGAEPLEVVQLAQLIANADLRSQIQGAHIRKSSVIGAMGFMQGSLTDIVASMRRNADSIASASAQIAQGTVELSVRNEQQVKTLEQAMETMKKLSDAVHQTADNALEANDLALAATTAADQGGQLVCKVVATMNDIDFASRKIADITGLIDSIAFQTNILALNAAVEAARAGEQGKGFAVVASEVRSLARRCGDAAKQIKSLISASVEKAERGATEVGNAGQTMLQIVERIERVGAAVGRISAAAHEQREGISTVIQAVSCMDQTTLKNSVLVEQSAAGAESLRTQAELMVNKVATFKI